MNEYGVCLFGDKIYLVIPNDEDIFFFETGKPLENKEKFVKYEKLLKLIRKPLSKYGCDKKFLALAYTESKDTVTYLVGKESINTFSNRSKDSIVFGAKYHGDVLSFTMKTELLKDIAELALNDDITDKVHILYNGEDTFLTFTNETLSWIWFVKPVKGVSAVQKYIEYFNGEPE